MSSKYICTANFIYDMLKKLNGMSEIERLQLAYKLFDKETVDKLIEELRRQKKND